MHPITRQMDKWMVPRKGSNFHSRTRVWAEIENELMEELQSDTNVLLKDRLKSLTQSRSKVDPKAIFTIANDNIQTVCDVPVKSLWRWYDSSLKDTSRTQDVTQSIKNEIQAIDTKRLQ